MLTPLFCRVILVYEVSVLYLRRKMDEQLLQWKQNSDRKPLIIKGARQIGKTETIRHFAKGNYASFIEINFITQPAFRTIIENGFDTQNMILLISRIDPSLRFIPGETLIFFDEIQAFPEIATSLKFFREDGRFDVICSGSLLGIQYRRIASISVGGKEDIRMHSMDFEEFLWAIGYGTDIARDLLTHMLNGIPFSETEYRVYAEHFLNYCILGGMPDVLMAYVEKRTFEGSLQIQHQLLTDYESDVRKYAEGLDQTRIINVFHSIPVQLAKEYKKFQYSTIAKGARAAQYTGCIEWLEDAGMINRCMCLSYPELPLKGNVDTEKFKVYMADTGLLIATLDEEAQVDLRSGRNLGVYKGALYENFAAEALVKQGYGLFYYKKDDSTLEEDFFIRSANELIPIEVKANANKAKSLNQLIKSASYPDIRHGIKFTTGNIGYENAVVTFPYFCEFLLKEYMRQQTIFM